MTIKEFETYFQERTPVDEKDNHLNKAKCREMIDAFVTAVTDALAEGETISFQGFGKFGIKERAAREGINPKTQEKIKISASKSPYFKPSSTLKDIVNGKSI